MTARCSLWTLLLLLLVASAASQSAQVLVVADSGSARSASSESGSLASGDHHSRDSSSGGSPSGGLVSGAMLDAQTLIQLATNPLRQTNTYKGLMSDLSDVGQSSYNGFNRLGGAVSSSYEQVQQALASRYASGEEMVLRALEMVLNNPQQFCANLARNGVQATAAQMTQQAGQSLGDVLGQAGQASANAGQSTGSYIRGLPSFGWGR